MNKFTLTLTLATAAIFVGCSQETTTSQEKTSTEKPEVVAAAEPSLPDGFFLNEAPANVVSLSEARSSAKAGEEIVFTGYIGGREQPFTEGRAMFVMADSVEAPQCTDACPVPHDACCTPNDVIAANSATVQVVDEEGKMMKLDLNGMNDLKAGGEVTIVGKVREATEGVFIVDASGVAINE